MGNLESSVNPTHIFLDCGRESKSVQITMKKKKESVLDPVEKDTIGIQFPIVSAAVVFIS